MNDGFLSNILQRPHPTSYGSCNLPILYSDASLLGLLYRVDVERAAMLTEDTPFEPLTAFGKATVLLAGFEYRQSTVGSYNEIGVAVLSKRRGTDPSLIATALDVRGATDTGLYVVNLPVTTEAARSAGADIWGFPKYTTGIDADIFERGANLNLKGEFDLTIGAARGLQTKGLPFVTLSQHRGRVIRTVIEVGHKTRWGGSSTVNLTVTGDGPTARSLKTLGLQGRTPMATFRTEAMRSILPAGVDLGEAGGYRRAA
jgi:hypothetical protein